MKPRLFRRSCGDDGHDLFRSPYRAYHDHVRGRAPCFAPYYDHDSYHVHPRAVALCHGRGRGDVRYLDDGLGRQSSLMTCEICGGRRGHCDDVRDHDPSLSLDPGGPDGCATNVCPYCVSGCGTNV